MLCRQLIKDANVRPERPKSDSPGQRPGSRPIQRLIALKGRNLSIVQESNSFTRRKRMPVHLPRRLQPMRALGAEESQNFAPPAGISEIDARDKRAAGVYPRGITFPTSSVRFGQRALNGIRIKHMTKSQPHGADSGFRRDKRPSVNQSRSLELTQRDKCQSKVVTKKLGWWIIRNGLDDLLLIWLSSSKAIEADLVI